MSDLDRDLREMFRRREGDVLIPPAAPGPVMRRTRRRQLGTVLTALGTALALMTTAAVGAAMLRGDGTTQVPGVDTSVGMRTTTGPYATATYPDSWLATVDGPDLALTNFDPGLDGSLCRRIDATMPDDGIALMVLPDIGAGIWRTPTPIADTRPWPVPLGDDQMMTDPSDCLGARTFRFTGWSAPNGVTFRAFAVAGPDALDADVAALDAAFASLTFPADDRPAIDPAETVRNGAPGLVLESGVTGGVAWNLVAFLPDAERDTGGQTGVACVRCAYVQLEIEQVGGPSGGAINVPPEPPDPDQLDTTVAFLTAGSREAPRIAGAVVYGEVGDRVAGAEALGSGGQVVRAPARIFEAPGSLGIAARLVVGSVEGKVQMAYTVGSLADGTPLNDPNYETDDPVVVAEGTDATAGPWTVTITPTSSGAHLSLTQDSGAGGGGDIGPLDGELFGAWQIGGGADVRHVMGLVRPDAARVDVLLPGGTTVQSSLFALPERFVGPASAFVAFLPADAFPTNGDIEAQFVAYDAAGVELGRTSTTHEEPAGPTIEIDAAWNLLRRARDELASYATRWPFDELRIVGIDSDIDYLVYGDPPRGRPQVGAVTVRVDDDRHLVALTRAETGEEYCLGIEVDDVEGAGFNYRYGSLNALTYQECTGGWS